MRLRAIPLLLLILWLAFPVGGESQIVQARRLVPLVPPAPPTHPPDGVHVRFIGARSFREGILREAIARPLIHITQRGLEETRADDAAFFLELFYRRQGFPEATVTYQLPGGNTLILIVAEGPKTYLAGVDFVGNREIPARILRDYLIGSTRERFSRWRTRLPYVEEDLENGVARLESFYLSEGFLDAVVEPFQARFTRDLSAAFVTVPIYEGPRYFFGEISLVGESVFGREVVLAEVADELAKPFTNPRLEAIRSELEFFYKTRGYFRAEVEAFAEEPLGARIPVTFFLEPGGFYRFDGVTVTGLDRLNPDFFQKRFTDFLGDPYDIRRLEQRYRELMRTGLFEELTYKETELPGNLVRLDFAAREAKARELGFYIGYGTYSGGIVGASYIDRNLFGTGRSFASRAEWAQRGLNAEVLYEDPWLFDTRNRFRARLYAETEERDAYELQASGLRLELTRPLSRHSEITGFGELKAAALNEPQIQPPEWLGPQSYGLGTVGVAYAYDSRGLTPLPIGGLVANSMIAYSAGGAGIGFGRASIRLSYYRPIGRTLLAAGLRVASILGADLEEVPIEERFFSGGATTVRSFSERELGPQDTRGKPIGGLSRSVFNLEYIVPVAGDLQAAVFADAGSVSTESTALVDDMRFAIGAGLRYQLPFGPIRLDYGWNPAPKRDEPDGSLHLSFGFAF